MSLLQIFNIFIYMFMSVVRHAVNHFLLVFCVSLHHVLIRLELTMYHCTIATSTWNRRLSTSTRVLRTVGGSCACSTASGIAREWELSGWPALGNTQLTAHVARLATCVTSDAQIWRQQRTRRPV